MISKMRNELAETFYTFLDYYDIPTFSDQRKLDSTEIQKGLRERELRILAKTLANNTIKELLSRIPFEEPKSD